MSCRVIAFVFACLSMSGATETLRYNVNWPSGLSLGEASLITDNLDASAVTRKFELKLDASIPGFVVADEFRALAKADYCSIQLDKKLKHGARIAEERMDFKPEDGFVERKSAKGGSTKIPLNGCGRDALTLVYFLRSELKQGRLPGAQTVFFGASYQVTFKYLGATSVQLGSGSEPADRMQISIKGPASQNTVEIFFGRDALRTPLIFKVPLLLGTYSMELQR